MVEHRQYSPEEINDNARQLSQYWEGTHDEAEHELGLLGFKRMAQPAFTCPELDPKALTNANLIEFGEMHTRFQAWYNYAENTFAYVRSILIGLNRQMDQLEARLKVLYASAKNPETGRVYSIEDRKTLMENTPRYIELLREKTKYEQMKVIAESQVERLSKSAALVSRHVELRKLAMGGDRTDSNLPSRGMQYR